MLAESLKGSAAWGIGNVLDVLDHVGGVGRACLAKSFFGAGAPLEGLCSALLAQIEVVGMWRTRLRVVGEKVCKTIGSMSLERSGGDW